MQIHCNVYCRGGVLPVGETSRSDSGGGVSAEECPSRNAYDICHPNAEQINPSVGDDADTRVRHPETHMIYAIQMRSRSIPP